MPSAVHIWICSSGNRAALSWTQGFPLPPAGSRSRAGTLLSDPALERPRSGSGRGCRARQEKLPGSGGARTPPHPPPHTHLQYSGESCNLLSWQLIFGIGIEAVLVLMLIPTLILMLTISRLSALAWGCCMFNLWHHTSEPQRYVECFCGWFGTSCKNWLNV